MLKLILIITLALGVFSSVNSQPTQIYSLLSDVNGCQYEVVDMETGSDIINNTVTGLFDSTPVVFFNYVDDDNVLVLGESFEGVCLITINSKGHVVKQKQTVKWTKEIVVAQTSSYYYDPEYNTVFGIGAGYNDNNAVIVTFNFTTLLHNSINVTGEGLVMGSYDNNTKIYWYLVQSDTGTGKTLYQYNFLTKVNSGPLPLVGAPSGFATMVRYNDSLYLTSSTNGRYNLVTLYSIDDTTGGVKELVSLENYNNELENTYWFSENYMVFLTEPNKNDDSSAITTLNLDTLQYSTNQLDVHLTIVNEWQKILNWVK
ncbi:hypothetical protein DLAC_08976 [Tieghemostelium lacteum]|uniref:Uncharacterized protein n=1 Tax=Tieghemostelium lacteum TaxID=361077 RepID=A0A151Z8S3_TIELA|nr:hypothetical protein DLAC_08976 [Tieghemostelium lacteum]|eukprot:KYQ90360.1 hypothetical protein DLAC_08976 [Tieghemostelium lacteum]